MPKICIPLGLHVVESKAESPTPHVEIPALLEHIVQDYAARNEFMGSVLVAQNGHVILNKGYGFANLEWKIPNSPATKFRLGSTTKQFTAAAILLLEEQGKLSLQDLVKKHLPDAPTAWDQMTIFHLLTHTAGIPNFTDFPEVSALMTQATTPDQLLSCFRNKPLEFQPGENYKYTNSGYTLLGLLIEKISGQNYSSFLQQNIFDPLGMKDSGYDSNTAIIPDRSSGYEQGTAGLENATYIHMSIAFSSGGLYSTTEDLLRWEQGLFGDKLLKTESLKKMITPFKSDYALGLFVRSENGHKVIEHGGTIAGFRAAFYHYPEDQLTVIVLGNLLSEASSIIAKKLGAAALGEKVTLPGDCKKVDPTVLDKYVGRYQITPALILSVTREGDHFYGQATGQSKVELYAEGEKEFFLSTTEISLTFQTDSQGHATGLILHKNGDHEVKRID